MAAAFVKISASMAGILGRRIRQLKGKHTHPLSANCNPLVNTNWYSSNTNVSDSLDSGETTASIGDGVIPGPSDAVLQSSSSDEQKKALQILWMELEVFRQSGYEVPKSLRDEDWHELMKLKSIPARRKYCRFLMIRDVRKEKEAALKAARRQTREEAQKQRALMDDYGDRDMSDYGLHRNTIFHRFLDPTMNVAYNHWACNAILFGPSLVFDVDYDEYMRNTDCQNCAEQIQMAYGYNKINREQFHLHLCNANPDGRTMKSLHLSMPNLYNWNCMINVTPNSYLELFPKERIVYLTPQGDHVLQRYNVDDVYVIGALVDKTIGKPVSLAKAKKEGLRIAKLPLDEHLLWAKSGKSLTLDQMMRIMVDLKNTGSWDVALKNVPRRKIRKVDDPEMQRMAGLHLKRRKPRWTMDFPDLKDICTSSHRKN